MGFSKKPLLTCERETSKALELVLGLVGPSVQNAGCGRDLGFGPQHRQRGRRACQIDGFCHRVSSASPVAGRAGLRQCARLTSLLQRLLDEVSGEAGFDALADCSGDIDRRDAFPPDDVAGAMFSWWMT